MPGRGRGGRGDMSDYEFERRMEDAHRRGYGGPGGYGGDGGFDDLLVWGLGILVAIIAVLAGAGWLDEQFGWGIRDWLIDRFTN